MADLEGRVAVVAGASRGAGRGIALALGDAGATVYVIGRTSSQDSRRAGFSGSIEETAGEVTRRGGIAIPMKADCTDDQQVAAVFSRVEAEQGGLDVLANAVWGAADAQMSTDDVMASWSKPFWEQSTDGWRHMMDGGPRAYFLASAHAIRLMARKEGKVRGLIAGVTDGYAETTGGASPNEMSGGPLLWTLSHLCINLLMKGMANEAKKKNIAVVTLMPGFMRTEHVMKVMTSEKTKKQFGFDRSESTEYVGRAVAALAADARVMAKTGKIHFVADLAREYGFTDVDGKQIPRFNPFARSS